MPDPISKNQMRDQIALLSFIDDLIKEKNDPSVKPEQIPQIKALLLKELNDMINTHLIKSLSEQDQRELDQLLGKDVNNEEIDQFFIKKIPNLEAELASVMLNFRAAYMFKFPDQKESQSAPKMPSPMPVKPVN